VEFQAREAPELSHSKKKKC